MQLMRTILCWEDHIAQLEARIRELRNELRAVMDDNDAMGLYAPTLCDQSLATRETGP